MKLFCTLVFAAILLPSLLGHLGNSYYVFDLFAQFQHYALAAGALLVLLGLMLKHKLLRLIALAIIISSGSVVLPLFFEAKPLAHTGRAKLISYNVLQINPDQPATAAWLCSAQADVVAMLEANEKWTATAEGLRDTYPHQYHLGAVGNFGAILLSRWPLTHTEVIPATRDNMSMIQSDITINGETIRFLLVHPIAPMNAAFTAQRNAQIRLIAKLAQQSQLPMVVMGDFNAAPWSPIMREFTRSTKLTGLNLRATWPSPFGPFGIPIDHILATPSLNLAPGGIGPAQGSDHRAVISWLP